jgi:hypothetical protein
MSKYLRYRSQNRGKAKMTAYAKPHDTQRERQLLEKSSFIIRRWLKLSVSVAFFSWQNGISAVC